MRHLKKGLNTFRNDRRGSFGVVAAVACPMLMLAMGFGVNLGQLYNVKSNLRASLDAAITSTARDITTGTIKPEDAEARVKDWLDANGDPDISGSSDIVLTNFKIDQLAKTVEADAYVDVDLFFPVFGMPDSKRVWTESGALYSDKKIEVALMLDITGSMAKDTKKKTDKIGDLKKAATNAVDTLLGKQDPKDARIRVAIVPYSEAVNVGSALSKYVYQETGYTTADPPLYSDVTPVSMGSKVDNCTTERKGTYQFSTANPKAGGMINRYYKLAACPPSEIMPLTSNLDALKTSIGKFTAVGRTAGHIGIQWTRYLLSSNWADYLPASAKPLPYDEKKVAKIAILMTDGEFNTAYADVGKGSDVYNQASKSGSKAKKHCDQMAADKIEVFTIGFMLTEDTAKDVMKYCASPDKAGVKHYYEAADGTALDLALQSIVGNIERLAITK